MRILGDLPSGKEGTPAESAVAILALESNPFAEELVSSGSDSEDHVPERWLPPAPAVQEAAVGMPRLPSRWIAK